MVAMVLADKRARHKSENDFRPRQTHQPHHLLQRFAMIPIRQRLQHILRGRIFSAEKPDVADAERRQRIARFDFAHSAERRGLFRPGFVRTAAPARTENHRDALVLIERSRHVRRYRRFIIRMRHHHQNIRLVTLIRLGLGLRLLRTDGNATEQHNPE